MKTFVYILYSEKLNRFYIGLTTLSVEERIENHLKKKYAKLNFTQKADDWKLYLSFEVLNYSQGRQLELFIKRMKSSKFIKSLKEDKVKYESILNKFKSFWLPRSFGAGGRCPEASGEPSWAHKAEDFSSAFFIFRPMNTIVYILYSEKLEREESVPAIKN